MKNFNNLEIKANQLLKQYFDYDNFRSGQIEIIHSIMSQHDSLAILPTGGGKSICFQVPGLFFKGTTIVISPLISLMKDQVDTLVRKKISAVYINSTLSAKQISDIYKNINNYKFIYVAPERLLNNKFILACQKIKISFLVVDEAHCISMWGHDFRPSYQKIPLFIEKLTAKPIIAAFTATATELVKKDIISLLKLDSPKEFIKSVRRDNLTLHTICAESNFDKDISLFRLLKKHQNEAGLIYTSTRYSVEYLADLINHFYPSLMVLGYHGGMDSKLRAEVQEKFIKNEVKLIVATNAFGMGVDKDNIRFVIHYQVPANLENYYQEAGRAGRDRKPSSCYLLFYPSDIAIQMGFINQTYPDDKNPRKETELIKLKTMVKFAQTKTCLNQKILEYFGQKKPAAQCSLCCNCLRLNSVKPSNEELLLQNKLTRFTLAISKKNHLPTAQIMTKNVMTQLALFKPANKKEILKLAGVGHGWAEKWYKLVKLSVLKA